MRFVFYFLVSYFSIKGMTGLAVYLGASDFTVAWGVPVLFTLLIFELIHPSGGKNAISDRD